MTAASCCLPTAKYTNSRYKQLVRVSTLSTLPVVTNKNNKKNLTQFSGLLVFEQLRILLALTLLTTTIIIIIIITARQHSLLCRALY